jgi:hypothetical protein
MKMWIMGNDNGMDNDNVMDNDNSMVMVSSFFM